MQGTKRFYYTKGADILCSLVGSVSTHKNLCSGQASPKIDATVSYSLTELQSKSSTRTSIKTDEKV